MGFQWGQGKRLLIPLPHSPRATPALAFQTPGERDLSTNWRFAIVPFVKALHCPQPHPSHHWDQQGWLRRAGGYNRSRHTQHSCLDSRLGPSKLGLCFGAGRQDIDFPLPPSPPYSTDGESKSHSVRPLDIQCAMPLAHFHWVFQR